MKIGIYALAKDESRHAAEWAAATAAADVRVVTDTGSNDDTRELLRGAGVTVAESAIVPWRWDVAWTQALCNLPADLDVAFRVDLDERPQAGWREAIEAAWDGEANNLVYDYWWSMRPDGSPLLQFHCDRVHARSGFVWRQATHEGLVCWSGEVRRKLAVGLVVEHHRDPGKAHASDMTLLRVAVRESPADARARWYLAREMDYAGMPTAAAEFAGYLKMVGGSPTERSYAFRRLASITGDPRHLERAMKEAPAEPDAWERMALVAHHQELWEQSATLAEQAIKSPAATHATDPLAKARAAELASIALWHLGRRSDALTHARAAAAQLHWDERIVGNAAAMEASL
jgi:hypothetical protein